MRRLLALLRADVRGGPAAEFAMTLPVLMIFLMGLSEMAYQGYVQSVLTGAVQKAGRDSGIQGNDTQAAVIDAKVTNIVASVVPKATFVSSRENFDNFTAIGPEPFTDTNKNGVRDPGECYSDINGNGQWDADPGTSGQGGANDVTVYKMTATYRRLFPFTAWVGLGSTVTLSATTILKNQPYATQNTTTVVTRCS